jgi:hypothetical protein
MNCGDHIELIYEFITTIYNLYLAAGLALLVLVIGFGEGDLIHGGNESYAVGDDRIIADYETYSESP